LLHSLMWSCPQEIIARSEPHPLWT
jgi:hypothetical protein